MMLMLVIVMMVLAIVSTFSWLSTLWRSEGMNCILVPWSGPLLLLLLRLIRLRTSSFSDSFSLSCHVQDLHLPASRFSLSSLFLLLLLFLLEKVLLKLLLLLLPVLSMSLQFHLEEEDLKDAIGYIGQGSWPRVSYQLPH